MNFELLSAEAESGRYSEQQIMRAIDEIFSPIIRQKFQLKPGKCETCGKQILWAVGHTHCENHCEMFARAQAWQDGQDKLRNLVNSGLMPRKCIRSEQGSEGQKIAIPWYTWDRSRADFETADRSAWETARAWAGDRSVIIWSHNNGNGKTDMARRMLFDRALHHQETIAELHAVTFVERTTGFSAPGVEAFFASRNLLLDDLDKGAWTAGSMGRLLRALDDRRDLDWPTIVTTNYPPRDGEGGLVGVLRAMAGKNTNLPLAILDRLKPALVIELTGPSLRNKDRTTTATKNGIRRIDGDFGEF